MIKNNLRICFITKKKFFKNDLLRFAVKNNEIFFDINNEIKSRGYYVCKEEKIIDKLFKNKILENKLKIKMKENVYDEIIKYMEETHESKNK